MGRIKHGLPPRSKSEREFDHEIGNIVFVLNAIDAGRLDHLFVDAETKAAVRADWMAKGEAVVLKYVRNYPGGAKARRAMEEPSPLRLSRRPHHARESVQALPQSALSLTDPRQPRP
jgi:hypothetical protein